MYRQINSKEYLISLIYPLNKKSIVFQKLLESFVYNIYFEMYLHKYKEQNLEITNEFTFGC